ncbi:MAG: right-handed parallel beta-helix repeat-containing protein [Muribaculaceae bacterium]|nr:right-handed parallel beta-helix repeat-containing protein [Muribaculaceae bacterium]
MKKQLLYLSLAMLPATLFANEFNSPGDGSTWNLEKLAAIDTVGVTLESAGVYVMAENVNIAAADKFVLESGVTLKMGNGVQFYSDGMVDMNCSTMTTITRNADTDEPKGFYIATEEPTGKMTVKNVNFEYAGLRTWFVGEMDVENCSFSNNNGKNSSSAALVFGPSGGKYNVTGCEFTSNTVPAIGCGGNVQIGLTIDGCTFNDNNTQNNNKPQINITAGGDNDIIIRNCTLKGGKRTMVGAISVANMMALEGTNNVLIENCDIRDHRYGITHTHGPMNITIKNNTIIDNKYETNAMNGGSGISLYDPYGYQNTYIEGNTIQGNLWGITIIGGANVNLGKTYDPTAADYNPGNNTFKDNGNNGVLYDLYNNGKSTVWAQGNTWNVDEQTNEKIETVIFHKADDETLGEVIYQEGADGVEGINADAIGQNAPVEYYNIQGIKVNNPTKGIYIKVQGNKATKVNLK